MNVNAHLDVTVDFGEAQVPRYLGYGYLVDVQRGMGKSMCRAYAASSSLGRLRLALRRERRSWRSAARGSTSGEGPSRE
jgi:hypothetical protein